MRYITDKNLFIFCAELAKEYEVYIPFKKGNSRFYDKFKEAHEDIVIGQVRTSDPLKVFFNPAREKVAEGFRPSLPDTGRRPICIVGAKACDLKGFKVQDFVFKDHDYADPFYIKMRQDNLVISSDCTFAIDTCFCLALGLKPYPQDDFDINLSQCEGGFLAEHGSTKGQEILKRYQDIFCEVSSDAQKQREQRRQRVIKAVEENIENNNIPYHDHFEGIIEGNYDSVLWKDEANTCVECGACNIICPTCHCFLLYDQKDKEKMQRLRVWDSCMIKDFARVAGGANPRAKLWMRLRNRFEKKFDFFHKVAGIYACTGCGRCISACPAKIDIRRVLKELVKNAKR